MAFIYKSGKAIDENRQVTIFSYGFPARLEIDARFGRYQDKLKEIDFYFEFVMFDNAGGKINIQNSIFRKVVLSRDLIFKSFLAYEFKIHRIDLEIKDYIRDLPNKAPLFSFDDVPPYLMARDERFAAFVYHQINKHHLNNQIEIFRSIFEDIKKGFSLIIKSGNSDMSFLRKAEVSETEFEVPLHELDKIFCDECAELGLDTGRQ
jgi:hypothetical protein